MPTFLFQFNGYIDERKRPENFPRVIHDILLWDCPNQQAVVNFVNDRCAMYTRNQGMGVKLDPYALETLGVLDTDRAWVPMHMITYLTAVHKPIVGELPGLAEDGQTVMPSGASVVTQ